MLKCHRNIVNILVNLFAWFFFQFNISRISKVGNITDYFQNFFPSTILWVFNNISLNTSLGKFTSSLNFSAATFYLHVRSGMQKNGHTKSKSVSDRKTTGNNAFSTLLPEWDLNFSFLKYVHGRSLQ